MTLHDLAPWAYLIAAVTFILGLKGLTSPKTAVLGNRIAAAGMLLAVAFTFLVQGTTNLPLIIAGIAVGGAIGLYGARAVKMTAMPQMVVLIDSLPRFTGQRLDHLQRQALSGFAITSGTGTAGLQAIGDAIDCMLIDDALAGAVRV